MITIYNVAGEQVRSVDLGRRSSGHHVWEWDGHGDRGEALGSGVYFIRLTVGSFSATRKAIMLK
jgi:flagellar hook assembly protein FlgD